MRARNYDHVEIYNVLHNLMLQNGATAILMELEDVMTTDQLADALTDVCDNWDINIEDYTK